MVAATEISSAYATNPAVMPMQANFGRTIDTSLLLANNENISATANGTAMDVEGGVMALATVIIKGVTSGTTPTLDLAVQVSRDGGTTYFTVLSFPQLDAADDNGFVLSRPVWLPYANTANRLLKTRVVKTAGGTTPVFNNVTVVLGPLGPGSDNSLNTLT